MKHSGAWIGGLVLFTAGLASGWAVRVLAGGQETEASESRDDDEAEPIEVDPRSMRLSVTTAEATRGELPITLAVSGRFRAAPAAERTLSSRAGGRVSEIVASPGQAVKQGEVLLRLDPAAAQAALGVARADLAEKLNRLTEFERTGSSRQSVELNVAAERANVQVSLLEAQVARLQPLHADGLVSDKALAEAQQALDGARAERTLSRGAENAFSSSGEKLQRATLTAARDAAELAAREAELALAEVEVRAPSDGQVVEWNVRGGETLTSGATLGRWLSAVGRELALQVPADKVREISRGLSVTWTDSEGRIESAKLDRVGGEIGAAGFLEVVASLERESSASSPGLRVLAEIELRKLPSAVLVPERAILRAQDEQVIVVARSEHAVRVPIRMLGRHGGLAAVEGELSAGERVVTSGGYNLPDGAGIVEHKDP